MGGGEEGELWEGKLREGEERMERGGGNMHCAPQSSRGLAEVKRLARQGFIHAAKCMSPPNYKLHISNKQCKSTLAYS
jgi:hypothetical protein